MSEEQALAFINKVRTDKALQKRIKGLRGRDALDQLSAIGAEAGFSFTDAEYRQAVVSSVDGELSEEAIQETAREIGLGR